MNSWDFLFKIEDVDEKLVQSSLDFLYGDKETDNMRKNKVVKFGTRLSKVAIVAAIMAGVLGVTALAAEFFPSVFRKAQKEITDKAAQVEPISKNQAEDLREYADLLDKAAKANQDAKPETTPLPEVDNGITIRETYYNGDDLLITYQFDEESMNLRTDFGPGSKHFNDLVPLVFNQPDGEPTFEEELKSGKMPKESYDKLMGTLKERGLSHFKYFSQYEMDERLRAQLSEDDYAAFYERLNKDGHAGISFRDMRIGGVMLEDGDILLGMGGQYRTDLGTCYSREGLEEYLPEKFKGNDTLNIKLLGSAIDVYWYMDLKNGASAYEEPVKEIQVPVTVTLTSEK